jgi:UDP-N-acetylmuramate dehydrogenase
VIKFSGEFSEIKLEPENIISCGSGVKISQLCLFALKNSLSGVEFLWGIPASVGGAIFMNAGAYGGEMKDILISCEHITPSGEYEVLKNEEVKLGYRESIYMKSGNIITAAKLKLERSDKESIKEKMDVFLKRRKEKQPLNFCNAGSIFKRPPGYYAGTLISECGLKGVSIGGAMVSEKHAGFIVNKGNAKCKDVLELIRLIQTEVYNQKGVHLEPEIRILN